MTILHSFHHSGEPDEHINPLNIEYVGQGGNANQGVYKFWFEKAVMLVNKNDHLRIKVINAHTTELAGRYIVVSYASTSPDEIIGPTSIDSPATEILFDVKLSAHRLAFLSVLVKDTFACPPNLISCDPQVGHDPPVI